MLRKAFCNHGRWMKSITWWSFPSRNGWRHLCVCAFQSAVRKDMGNIFVSFSGQRNHPPSAQLKLYHPISFEHHVHCLSCQRINKREPKNAWERQAKFNCDGFVLLTWHVKGKLRTEGEKSAFCFYKRCISLHAVLVLIPNIHNLRVASGIHCQKTKMLHHKTKFENPKQINRRFVSMKLAKIYY